ncbi:HEAT repeat domain-containing protein [Vibrio clamense]|uniref:HEAT repeat domain-containing protein n=1 Tax=Vibrio clamense TaxID=2910254 RepID=UPI000DE94BB9|nr:hypothetical protein DS893_10360 [Vibrionales bacterium C3R12]
MKHITIAIFSIVLLGVLGWFNISAKEPKELIKKINSLPNKQEASENLTTHSTNRPDGLIQNNLIKEDASPSHLTLNQEQALQSIEMLLANISNGQRVDLATERKVLAYLKENNDEYVYQLIANYINKAVPGDPNDDRMVKYCLSLLAVIDSFSASELFFSLILEDNWQEFDDIYSVRQSISKLTMNVDYTELIQQSFTQADEFNPFISDLASAIGRNAQTEQVDYLLEYVDSPIENKSRAANNAMNQIKTEALVPSITPYLYDESTDSVKTAALNSLAHMGQYEAASALISWSSQQPLDAADKIEHLFTIALSRSPSTKRAIEKEINTQNFSNEELKTLIINLSIK